MERPSLYLGGFAIFLLALLGLQLYEDSLKLTATSTGVVVLLFGVLLVLSYPDITRIKVGLGGVEFERRATELTTKILTTSAAKQRALAYVAAPIVQADPRGALFTVLVEIEREMRRLTGVSEPLAFGELMRKLISKDLLDENLQEALEFLRTVRNSAFHGEYLSEDQIKAATNLGSVVLSSLREKSA